MLGMNDVVVAKTGAMAAEIDGALVLLSLDRGNYCSLNAVGYDIWRHLAAPVTLEALLQQMQQEYQGDPEIILADLRALLSQLEEQALIDVIRT